MRVIKNINILIAIFLMSIAIINFILTSNDIYLIGNYSGIVTVCCAILASVFITIFLLSFQYYKECMTKDDVNEIKKSIEDLSTTMTDGIRSIEKELK